MEPVTADQLRRAEADFRKADEGREAKREKRNALVRRALGEGWTHQQVSDATGLSRGRISQILKGAT